MQHEVTDFKWYPAFYDDLTDMFPDEKVEILRDKKCACTQLENGNLSFFTQTLPKLHNEALAALERGAAPPKFSHLGWLLRRVWDHPESCSAALALMCHRQLCHALYKLEVPYAAETLTSTYASYLATEEDLQFWSARISDSGGNPLGSTLSRAHHLLTQVAPQISLISDSRTQVLRGDLGLRPGHGPGSVATGETGDDKWDFSHKYSSLHQRFPYYDWFVTRGAESLLDQLRWYRSLKDVPYPSSKMVAVPKDSRGPRLISEEPLEIQFIQQAYLRFMTSWARKKPMEGHVFFDDQKVHRNLALLTSKSRTYATLDLKDASDRVSLSLVSRIFPDPIVRDLCAMRSTTTCLPDGRVVPLRKMSPMGSSVCFPTMAYTLWALCACALEYHTSACFGGNMQDYDVYIFGDDIIVPVDAVSWVRSTLQSVGLMVNETKSFVSSFFRESCGMDAYAGVDITPVRIRKAMGCRALSDEVYLSNLAYVNGLRKRGWYQTANRLQQQLASTHGALPLTWNTESYPGILVGTDQDVNVPMRWSRSLSSLMAYAEIPIGVTRRVKLNGRARLLRNLTMGPGERPGSATVRGQVKMRRAWVKVSKPTL